MAAGGGARPEDLRGNGGCGDSEGPAGVKAEEAEGMEATAGGAAPPPPAALLPKGRAVLL